VRRVASVSVTVALCALVASRVLAATVPAPVSTPPPTPVPPHGSPSPFPTALATPVPSLRTPKLTAGSAVLEDLDTGQVLLGIREDVPRPVASLTKIMTAYVVLHHLSPSHVVTVSAEAAQLGAARVGLSVLGVRDGEKLTVRELLEALLLQSANDAAVALADGVSATTDDFVALMNRTAGKLDLRGTRFRSPNGLDDRGHSTAWSLATLTRDAERLPLFAKLVRTEFATIPAPAGRKPRVVQNRNVLLWLYPGATGVKTGYTARSGYCLVATATSGGQRLAAVVLGEPSSQSSFNDAAALLNYGFHSFLPERVIENGRTFPATAAGERYNVAATRSLRAWVRSDERAPPAFSVRLPDRALREGDVAGTVVARIHGRVLGRVPLVVVADLGPATPPVQPGAPPPPPWWAASLQSFDRVASDVYHSVFG